MDNPTGTAPLTTDGNGSQGIPASVPPQGTETVEELRARLVQAERERDEARQAELRANRAVEAGKKFEKFEDFQKVVFTKIEGLETSQAAKDKEIEDLKSILAQRSSVTPNYSATPSTVTPPSQPTEEVNRLNSMFGTKLQ